MAGTPFGDNTGGSYIDGIQYRAFGQIKQMTLKTDGNNQVSMQYDTRLRVSQHQVTSTNAAGGFVQKAAFAYFSDSSPQQMDNQVNHQFDRSFAFDFAARLTRNDFGSTQTTGIPYTQTVQYDAFSQMTNRSIAEWGVFGGFGAAYVNGRKQAAGNQTPIYDASGNSLDSGARTNGTYQTTTFDAANRQGTTTTRERRNYGQHTVWTYIHGQTGTSDGDGNQVKQTDSWQVFSGGTPPAPTVGSGYQVWSTVLDTALTEIDQAGAKMKTAVVAGAAVIAEQTIDNAGARVEWITADPLSGSTARLRKTGAFYDDERTEREPFGQ